MQVFARIDRDLIPGPGMGYFRGSVCRHGPGLRPSLHHSGGSLGQGHGQGRGNIPGPGLDSNHISGLGQAQGADRDENYFS
jgi:hypothetical protein